ncbi:hypothetical protein GCM10007416_20380 [Kroppenstedtia guangzhouensis]|uniref:Uncharacterized protein n=1 Tax=Kroppenstedtia guangzhouensis TaxID=1274356 RepID=A0ABQ1GN55_9BACL|nr:hypothetical protein [Kroppenstedtia guangzhouensis]GGA47113.1 hypothetical protein GCM10007416_20380 [Kroppenstedtia guangzhouensis]
MSIGKIRTLLYGAARFLGDINAVRQGRVKERLKRRLAGKVTGRLMGRWFR